MTSSTGRFRTLKIWPRDWRNGRGFFRNEKLLPGSGRGAKEVKNLRLSSHRLSDECKKGKQRRPKILQSRRVLRRFFRFLPIQSNGIRQNGPERSSSTIPKAKKSKFPGSVLVLSILTPANKFLKDGSSASGTSTSLRKFAFPS